MNLLSRHLTRATIAAFRYSQGQIQFAKHGGKLARSIAVTSFAYLTATTEPAPRIPLPDVPPQSLSCFAGINLRLTQTLGNQIVITPQNMLQYLEHQGVSEVLQFILDAG